MYKDFFHLRCEPFNITPDPRFLYMTAQHQEAIDHLLYGIRQRKGFMMLTGEVGAGKTTICRELLARLGPGFHTALILNPMLTGTQLLRATLAELGLAVTRQDRLWCLNELNRFLLAASAAGEETVLIIDEAQDIPLETLELTRLLSNLETDSHKLLQIVLVGQPELRSRLARQSLRQLAQRITVRYHLDALSRDDTAGYIRHRLRLSSASDVAADQQPAVPVQFDESAISEIYYQSGGTPRLINSLGDKALLAGYVHGTDRIDRRLVKLAAAEMKESLR